MISCMAYCMYVSMIHKIGHTYVLLVAILVVIAMHGFRMQPAWADTRQDAAAELSRLQQSAIARLMAEETRSIEAAIALAEQYLQAGDIEQSERYYQLAIQKTRLLLPSLPGEAPLAVASPDTPATTAAAENPEPAPSPSAPPLEETRTVEPAPSGVVEPALPEIADIPTAGIRESITARSPETEPFPDEIVSEKLVGTASTYSVVKGDTIRLVAAKLGVSRKHIIRQNNLDEKAYLKIGQKLAYNNRKIVPQRMKNGIVVNIPDRTLYYFKKGKLAITLPVALGVPVKSDKYDWKTPTGKFKITAKMKDPTWHVPSSIRSEMEDQGREIITSIPPGPENPLGKYAFKTSIPGILIHSATKPWSIYSFASHGCIRVYPEQMEGFFKEVAVNTPGEIIYKPVKLAVTEQGRVFLEVHQDVYNKSSGLGQEARRLIERQHLAGQVDWQKVESIVQRKSGIAEDITL